MYRRLITTLLLSALLLSCSKTRKVGDSINDSDVASSDSGARDDISVQTDAREINGGAAGDTDSRVAGDTNSSKDDGGFTSGSPGGGYDGGIISADSAVNTTRIKCPQNEPSPGESCTDDGILCGYGDSARADCRRLYQCNKTWNDMSPLCLQPPEGYCPNTLPDGEQCEPIDYDGKEVFVGVGVECSYSSGAICYCYSCNWSRPSCKEGKAHWDCKTQTEEDCPQLAPNIGEICSTQGIECVYGDLCEQSGQVLLCSDGSWETSSKRISCSE